MRIVFDTYRSSLFAAIELGVILGSIGVIVSPSMIYAALSLGVTLFSIAFLYLLFNADLLAAVQVLVYIGAINVLIVFAIMLVGPTPLPPSRPLAYRLLCFGVVSGLCLPLVFASTEGLWNRTKLEIPGKRAG
jgi:NADH:ubiquinone oxidoreductase subunit 6 (subunit J)|uniref:subunit 6 of NADH-plastoquinone oxidoreductase n=1 Tax=Klebsormidium crenulatum TaxID=424406 RepID=UPI00286B6E38|nr:subunit 6 of NADH-plastoquinone oxidoreductase [Klebsormidium crenulatum]YP_010932601.1 subunit 6 of NADH-plastoquinone oxidoreductase [Klebsormidium crenulatum]YP_010932905.1 subunit 6 of NADH-plastoquinone oxidoreductase [Klebsormidium mucosum]YP_010932931.1 subunit 6 of NADH-plastoquinone oxidoreductase [Klebsormidium mucosum]WKT06410.1 subunit 6 of NADH-plastoquinone oxidoreductase [Klebsormidium crenulatum]WKT06411.1 subunit 6 of NADH-plastoquinone oxidoreductase [Klebsormidium crenula